MNGFAILAIYAVVMITATLIFTKKEKNVERFCVGSRKENWIMSALSIAATWIWAPALFVSTEKAYANGFVGLFGFGTKRIMLDPFHTVCEKDTEGNARRNYIVWLHEG